MVNNLSGYVNFKGAVQTQSASQKTVQEKSNTENNSVQERQQSCSAETVMAYRTSGLKTTLATEESKQKYNELSSMLEPDTKVELSKLLKAGVLLNNNSNDGSTVLDNLHKIVTEPRVRGLDAKTLATETITAISNPGSITQNFGDIPDSVQRAVFRHPEFGVFTSEEMDIGENSNCCVAANIEYNLACTKPAEFARMAAGLSSEDMSVTKNLKLSDIADKKEDALWLLDKFKLPHQKGEGDNIQVTISPDRSAIIRARVQTSYRDSGERSSIDVLMQSALMNIGSQQTYNSLNDKRVGLFSPSSEGLTNLEKTFAEEVFTGEGKAPVVYMGLDETGRIEQRACDYQTMAQQLVTALQTDNVIAGIVYFNENEQVIGGHEMTIIDATETPTGDLAFVLNDTQDNNDEPICVLAENLLPRLHHAALPKDIVDSSVFTEFDAIQYYKEQLG